MSPQYGELGPLAAEIDPVVWGTHANFNGFCVLAALLHGTLVVRISQTLWRWTEGATYIRQGDHHIGHWPTFLVFSVSVFIHHHNARVSYCENTKTESVYFDGKFPSIDHAECGVILHTWCGHLLHILSGWSVSLSQLYLRTHHSDCVPYVLSPSAASVSTWTTIKT